MSAHDAAGPQRAHGARAAELGELTAQAGLPELVGALERTALDGLSRMLLGTELRYPQTARRTPDGSGLAMEGVNPRYAAIVALGLGHLDEAAQREVLRGRRAGELAARAVQDALAGTDLGALALAAWAAAETGDADAAAPALSRIDERLRAGTPVPTVDLSWAITALLAQPPASPATTLLDTAVQRLLGAQGGGGIFPHVIPAGAQSRLRAHVGCYADQVYPIQALARYAAASGDTRALAAADRCAGRIVQLQGPQGQWWWHYDARTGDVVEGFPVYSVHQHAMGPMALLELHEAGGLDCRRAVAAGLNWLPAHPDSGEALIAEPLGVIWRKVGRREPRKALRSLRAATTALRPGLRFGALDRIFPPGPVDHECRPYELGWLLYAWRSAGVVGSLPAGGAGRSTAGDA